MFTLFSIFLNFLEFFHFPKITRKRSGFLGIREISFKVETLGRVLLLDREKDQKRWIVLWDVYVSQQTFPLILHKASIITPDAVNCQNYYCKVFRFTMCMSNVQSHTHTHTHTHTKHRVCMNSYCDCFSNCFFLKTSCRCKIM